MNQTKCSKRVYTLVFTAFSFEEWALLFLARNPFRVAHCEGKSDWLKPWGSSLEDIVFYCWSESSCLPDRSAKRDSGDVKQLYLQCWQRFR